MAVNPDGKVIISTELDNSGFEKDAQKVAPIIEPEMSKAGAEAAKAYKQAFDEALNKSPAKTAPIVIDLDTGSVAQAGADAVAVSADATQAAQKAVSAAREASDVSATVSGSLSETAQGVNSVSASISKEDAIIQKILSDTERSAKSKAASIAAIYRKQGLSQKEAFKKAWEQIERSSAKSTQNVGRNIRKNIGGSTQVVTGQLGGLNNVVKNLGASIASAFSVAAIVGFAVESVKAANQLADALTGLKSILDGQGRSFSDAQKFLEEYTADGLIPMADAINAYKNLAARGYDDSQIKQIMIALKDASAFGRQASYSMGEAVKGATEGLKNENSVLVDNAGVTKNVAKMWEEYAASIGTTASNLTMEQKRQAEYNGIMEETKFQVGDAAKVASTLSGQLSLLSSNFTRLKEAVGNALRPIVQSFLPVINVAIATLTRFANAIASVVGALFGSATSGTAEATQEVADSYNSAAEGAENLAKSTEKAGKAAKKYLAGFDELTKIGDSSGGGGSGSASSISSSATKTSKNSDENEDSPLSPQLQAAVDKIKQLIEPLKNIDFTNAKESIGGLIGVLGELGVVCVEQLEWVWFNVLAPLAEWSIEEGSPATVNLLTAALSALAALLKPLQAGFQELMIALQPVFQFIGEVIIVALDGLRSIFEKVAATFEEKGGKIQGIISGIGEIVSVVWAQLEPVLQNWKELFGDTFEYIGDMVSTWIGFIIDILYGLVEFFAGVLTGDWSRAWSGITGIFTGAKEAIGKAISALKNLLGSAWTSIVNNATLTFNRFKTFLVDKVWGGIVSGIKSAANGIIGFINGLVSGIVTGINAIIWALNRLKIDIPEWVPMFGGKTFGFNLKQLSTPQIPYLAKGAVLPANKPFLAVVGDQKHGTNVEAPLETIQEAVALVMEDYAASNLAGQEAIIAVLREILEAVLGIEIGDEIIGQAVARYNRKVAVMRGGA